MNRKVVFRVLLLVAVLLVFNHNVYSKEDDVLDVMLLIDSSGSMKETDPRGLRVPASKLFISLLGKEDNIGILTFHEDVINLANLTEAAKHQSELLAAAEKVTSEGKFTDIYKAIISAEETIEKAARKDSKKIIVLMSDGKIDVGDTQKDEELRAKLLSEILQGLKEKNIKLYTIAFTSLSDTNLLEIIARETGGAFSLLESAENFHNAFISIFESLKIPQMLPIEKNTFNVDISVTDITIIANKEAPDSTLILRAPNKEKYMSRKKPRDFTWFTSPTFDMITINEPQKGTWQILFSTGNGNKAYIVTNLQLSSNLSDMKFYPYWPIGDTIDVQAWLDNKDDVMQDIKSMFIGTNFYAEIKDPHGNIKKLSLTAAPTKEEGGANIKYINSYKPETAGTYEIKVAAEGKTFKRMKVFTISVIEPTKDMVAYKEKERQEQQAQKEKIAAAKEAAAKEEKKAQVATSPAHITVQKLDKTVQKEQIIRTVISFVAANIGLAVIIILYLKGINIVRFIKTRKKRGKGRD